MRGVWGRNQRNECQGQKEEDEDTFGVKIRTPQAEFYVSWSSFSDRSESTAGPEVTQCA